MLAEAEGPPGVSVSVTSAGTSYRVKVADPVVMFGGLTKISYVPAAGSVRASMKPVPLPMAELLPTALPSGPTIDTVADEKVEDVILTLIRWPAAALKLRRAFCPGVCVDMDAAAPPGVIGPPASGGTSNRVKVAEPVAAPCGSTTIVYAPVAVSDMVSMNAPLVLT